MIIVNVLTSPVANSIVNVGRQGKNNAREVWFDLRCNLHMIVKCPDYPIPLPTILATLA